MNQTKGTISLILLLLSFTLILADCNLLSYSDSTLVTSCTTCPDISDHFEHSHSLGSEDVIINETKSKTIQINYQVNFISTADVNIKSNFISNIWQPPKFS